MLQNIKYLLCSVLAITKHHILSPLWYHWSTTGFYHCSGATAAQMRENGRHEGLWCSSTFDNKVKDNLLGLTNIIMSHFYNFY